MKTLARRRLRLHGHPAAGGKITYKVSYAGDATHAAAPGSDTVDVYRGVTLR